MKNRTQNKLQATIHMENYLSFLKTRVKPKYFKIS